jgi:cyanate lyase
LKYSDIRKSSKEHLLVASKEMPSFIDLPLIIPFALNWSANFRSISMSIPAVTQQLLAAKQAKGISFADLEKILGRDEVWIAALFYRQASASAEEAEKIVKALGLDAAVAIELTQFPVKGSDMLVPIDPLIYRFYEIMQVYGMALKEVIQEKFGDGIMSAIDFTMDVEKEADPKGDRVKIVMSGKFLSYKKW